MHQPFASLRGLAEHIAALEVELGAARTNRDRDIIAAHQAGTHPLDICAAARLSPAGVQKVLVKHSVITPAPRKPKAA
ncbi:hypothetical protein Xcel_0563 [Xylanimonas cellulosilytica DSM 15894]|uniref:Uncharacterized protein n=1 Tax=Xylanimonas cellulosilytica (strain DSM 15894 / JCM 12276 / CECT 5975 / KCTC 9989 / LMG 20990 / NBRC 107835 / XIL07) TaxID=446471 RepID=D1BWM0_XYLCX|nr:hypothetical protein [Xylanimonas cellulosilytica]ACZ29602.1 hypothetical protein Xcel_0563 [Xylanimonas cellulosilytica DSM 15894]